MNERIQELRKQYAENLKRNRELLDKAKTEKRQFTEEEEKLFGETNIANEKIIKDIEREEMLVSQERALAGIQEMRTLPDGTSVPVDKTPTNAPESRTEVTEVKEKPPFRTLGDQLRAIALASNQANGYMQEVRTLNEYNQRAITGLGGTVPSDGGFLLQTEFSDTIMQTMWDDGSIIDRVTTLPMTNPSADSIEIPAIDETSRVTGSRLGGIQSYWKAEGDTVTASKPKFRNIRLQFKELMALVYSTNSLLQNSSALQALIEAEYPKEMRWMIQEAILNGNGATRPLGILNSNALITVAKENNQGAQTILAMNVIKMVSRVVGANSDLIWIANRDILPQLSTLQIITGTTGQLLFQPANANQNFQTLYGYPIVFLEQAKTLGTVGDLILADFSQYLMIRRGLQVASSIHVRFLYDESVFRFITYVDGQPWWNSAVTPANGTATRSPFVALATR